MMDGLMTKGPMTKGRGTVRRFGRDVSGIGAVEFAMIAPFLFLLYLGGSELTIAITIDRKVEQTGSTINDLVAQAPALNADELKGIFQISEAVMTPYSSEGLQIRVTSVHIDDKGVAKVDWDCPTVGLARLGKGTPFDLPDEFSALRERYLIVAETTYPYQPMSAQVFTGSIEMGSTSYLDPRIGENVVSPGCAPITL